MSSIERSCDFRSVSECVAFLKQCFADQTTEVPDTTSHERRLVPRYLFRGEDRVYPDTVPAVHRLERDDLDKNDHSEIVGITNKIVHRFQDPGFNFNEGRGMNPRNAAGLVQHLRLPTEYLDFSADPEVAGAFAVKYSSTGQRARSCVVDVQRWESGSAEIADFQGHRWCERACRQKAFGYGPISFRNLQSPEARDKAGVWWFEVTVCEADIERFGRKYAELIDTYSDPSAGLVRWQVNCYVTLVQIGPSLRPGGRAHTGGQRAEPLID